MEYGEIFNEAFDLYKRNFLLLVGIGAVVYLPYAILTTLVLHSPTAQWLVMLGFAVPLCAAYGALVKALADSYLGEPVSIGEAWRYVMRRIVPLMLTYLIVASVIGLVAIGFVFFVTYAVRDRGFGGAILITLVGLVLMVLAAFWLAFLPSVMIVEDRFYLAALRRSRELSKGNWARIFVVSLCAGIVAYGLMTVVVGLFAVLIGVQTVMTGNAGASGPPGAPRGLLIGMQLVTGTMQALLTPITVMPFVLLYFDVRVRREGYDVELLAREMGGLPPGAPPPAPA
jgi:hypothetical protein